MSLPSHITTSDVMRWLAEDSDRVWMLLSLWNKACQNLHDEGICEFIIGGLCLDELTEALKAGADLEW